MSHGEKNYKYVYEIPLQIRSKLCLILDNNDAWTTLGGNYMDYDVLTLNQLKKSKSPSDELLTMWGTKNHTIVSLFFLLSRMEHYQAMSVLKPIVPSEYHHLLFEGDSNLNKRLAQGASARNSSFPKDGSEDKFLEFGEHNINKAAKKNDFCPLNEKKVINNEPPSSTNQPRPKMGDWLVADEEFLKRTSIPYHELELATENWKDSNQLGKGGFGTVFKGVWKHFNVAIKRMNQAGTGEDKIQRNQLLTELRWLNMYKHDNILPLYAFSIGGPFDCLVYQYMQNGSLEDNLVCRGNHQPLLWSQRHSIAVGTAGALQFLHTLSSEKPLVHGDIKSANILLDPYFVPKIGDFGLAREGPLEKYTHIKVSSVHGTRAYLPDEFVRFRKLSTKVDTYCFGTVLFELATGFRSYDNSRATKYLKDYMHELSDYELDSCKDIKAGPDKNGDLFFKTFINLGKICTASDPGKRPKMEDVLRELYKCSNARDSTVTVASPVRLYPPVLPEVAQPVFENPNTSEIPELLQEPPRWSQLMPSGFLEPSP